MRSGKYGQLDDDFFYATNGEIYKLESSFFGLGKKKFKCPECGFELDEEIVNTGICPSCCKVFGNEHVERSGYLYTPNGRKYEINSSFFGLGEKYIVCPNCGAKNNTEEIKPYYMCKDCGMSLDDYRYSNLRY
ncbi:MAG: hypothetical protein PHF18_13915 [Methanosarcina sp.]|uniref:hypothetical protein n=1 Tax=Methanosarcina sp. TaxID=2213 RepID=UPI002638AF22|nr:hypothetical protein [Methanosarcina sp.]MDD3247923.1 hypothetical protein [Methanosarcina sp.]MDD4248167.1 hypothetical protein [Methanosarcina sp.]